MFSIAMMFARLATSWDDVDWNATIGLLLLLAFIIGIVCAIRKECSGRVVESDGCASPPDVNKQDDLADRPSCAEDHQNDIAHTVRRSIPLQDAHKQNGLRTMQEENHTEHDEEFVTPSIAKTMFVIAEIILILTVLGVMHLLIMSNLGDYESHVGFNILVIIGGLAVATIAHFYLRILYEITIVFFEQTRILKQIRDKIE